MKLGILFDLDGTLLDTLEDLRDAVNHTMRQYGCPERTLEDIRLFISNGVDQLVRLSLEGAADVPPLEEAVKTYKAYYAAHSQIKTRPYDGVLEALTEVNRRFPVAIVTNKPHIAAKPLCQHFFGDIYARGVSDDCPRKPAPDMVHKTMAALGVDACVYVGDSEVDVITARNAGVPCLSVLWGFRDQAQLEAEGAKYFCDDPAKLPEMLEKIAEEYYGK